MAYTSVDSDMRFQFRTVLAIITLLAQGLETDIAKLYRQHRLIEASKRYDSFTNSRIVPAMDWSDDGIVLSARKHGESSAIVTLLTRGHGRHAGLVRGGAGRRQRGIYLIGNHLAATWRARLEEQLGSYSCEMVRAYAAEVMSAKLPLAALSSAAILIDMTLPEREPHENVFTEFSNLLDALLKPDWESKYVLWELGYLSALGFGLDLASCAVTGVTENLTHVSPRTGRAVSTDAGAAYRDRLLDLPSFLRLDSAKEPPMRADILAGLTLTGHFLGRFVFAPDNRDIPAARRRLVDGIGKTDTISSDINTS
jgi:DNA repair protein RecO (recombination protein O)